ncbi:MAG: Na+/H+ antiporter NhaC family protein [Phycisphaerales bacterium]
MNQQNPGGWHGDIDESMNKAKTTTLWRVFHPSRAALIVTLGTLLAALLVGIYAKPHWSIQRTALDVRTNDAGELVHTVRKKEVRLGAVTPAADAQLTQEKLSALAPGELPAVASEIVAGDEVVEGQATKVYKLVTVARHWGPWSLMPAAVAITLCLLTKEPLTALLGGIVVGALMLRMYDLTGEVLLPSLASLDAAGVLLLYLWLLGGLMGIWSRTGAAQAFARFMTKHFVRGPKSAKFVAWSLGVVFFQGGTVSTVLVGTTVKPIADEQKVSHEELSYIVDSTASPIASVIAFNAWPAYIQGLIYVPGVAFLATESDRLAFFFKSVPLSFYGLFAVFGTLLLTLDKAPFLGKRFRKAIARSRETGQLDEPGSTPLSSKELQASHVPAGYTPRVIEFFLPLAVLLTIAIGTFISSGSPNVQWAFGAALLLSAAMALARGMELADLMEGFGEGLKGVVVASVILMLAITLGSISKQSGGGLYLVDLLGDKLPYWLLPVTLQVLTMIIAFSTGTSWGTYAIAFPLGMPLAWAITHSQGLEHPMLFMMVCFATILNGSVYGDQCSPISDTTVLSAMTTGADLMDHVKTQLIPATAAATLAGIGWTLTVVLFV